MAGKTISELVLNISANTADLKQELQEVKKQVGGLSNLGGTVAKFAAGFISAGAAIEVAKKAIDSTSGSADKFEEIIGAAKLTSQKFFQTLATGDFSNLISNLKEAAKAGMEYAASMDEISERTLGLSLTKSKILPEQSQLTEVFRDKTADPIKRQEALNTYKKNAVELATKEHNIALANVQAEEDRLKALGVSGEALKYLYENYEDSLIIIRAAGDKMSRLQEITKEYQQTGALNIAKRNKLEEEALAIRASMTDEEKQYFNLLLNNNLAKQEDIDLMIKAYQNEYSTKAAINQVDVENLKIQNNITKEINDQNKELKDQQTIKATMESTKANAVQKISTKVKGPSITTMLHSGKGLKLEGIQESTIQVSEQMATSLGIVENSVQSLESSFQTLFLNVGGGFKGMIKSLMDSVKMLLAQLAAKAAIFGILQLLFPGSGMAVGALTSLRSFIGIPGFANGTNYAPGGWAIVGEKGPEIVNLSRGSQVIPNNVAFGGSNKVRIEGTDIVIVSNKVNKISLAY